MIVTRDAACADCVVITPLVFGLLVQWMTMGFTNIEAVGTSQ